MYVYPYNCVPNMYRMKKKHFFNATDLLCFTIFIIYNEYTEKKYKKETNYGKNKDKRRKSIFLFKK